MADPRLLDSTLVRQLLSDVDNIFLDCDGVLWNGLKVIPGTRETVRKLMMLGKRVFYVTNSSSRSRQENVERFRKMDFPAEIEQVMSTAYVAATYLHNINFEGKVYAIGERGLGDELDSYGIKHIGIGPDPIHGTMEDWLNIQLDPEVKCVLVAFDSHLSYLKVLKAASYIKEKDCLFIATNEDSCSPLNGGDITIPGTGVMVQTVKTASQKQPFVVGKPHRTIFDTLLKMHGLDESRTIMVGDCLETDIAIAKSFSMKSLLVLTGFSTLDDVEKYRNNTQLLPESRWVPEFYLPSFGDLFKLLPDASTS